MKKIKIAFIQRSWDDNLGLLWISAFLKKNGFISEIWIDTKNTYNEIEHFSPDIVGYSCITGEQKWLLSSIDKIKELNNNIKIIVGGPHPTFFPKLVESNNIDVICRGEGEYALLEYAQALEKGNNRYDIKNLYFNIKGKIVKNELRSLINDLDSIPYPDRSYYEKYKFLRTNPFKIFITSRGCPYKCTFCFNHSLLNLYNNSCKYIRRRSVANVLKEIEEVNTKWGIKEIRFSDDHFALSAHWLKEFMENYRGKIKKPYTINARADSLNEEKIHYLKESGCRLVCFGIETGDEKLRNDVLKKRITDNQIYNIAKLLKKYKIKFLTSNIIGLPNETVEQAWKTIEINQKIKTDLPWFSMMQYFPGTQIFEKAKIENLINDDFSCDEIKSYFENSYLNQKNISELQNIHSFSIITAKYKFLTSIAKFLSKKFKPNIFFKIIFKISYLKLSAKRANLNIFNVIYGIKYYLNKIIG